MRLGAGRVMSQTEMAAVFLPAARSRSEGPATGWSRARLRAASRSSIREAVRLSMTS